MRKAGVHPVVVSGTVAHKRVELAPEVYDQATQSEIRDALGLVGKQLLPNGYRVGCRTSYVVENGERGRNRTYNLLIKSS